MMNLGLNPIRFGAFVSAQSLPSLRRQALEATEITPVLTYLQALHTAEPSNFAVDTKKGTCQWSKQLAPVKQVVLSLISDITSSPGFGSESLGIIDLPQKPTTLERLQTLQQRLSNTPVPIDTQIEEALNQAIAIEQAKIPPTWL